MVYDLPKGLQRSPIIVYGYQQLLSTAEQSQSLCDSSGVNDQLATTVTIMWSLRDQ